MGWSGGELAQTLVGAMSRPVREVVLALVCGGGALALYLVTLAPSITLVNGAGDSGELASTAYTLGIAHPTGYPLYMLIGFVVTHLLPAEPARSLNIFSALMGALTIGLLALLATRLARRVAAAAPWPLAALATVLPLAALALSPTFWTEAIVTETRTLALALDALILVLLVAPCAPSRPRALLAAVLYGLALGDHLLSLYLAPALLALLYPWARRSPRRWAALLCLFLVGLSCYLYLPLRAAMRPAADWGHPDTLARLLWVVSGREYRYQMFSLGGTAFAARTGNSLVAIVQQLNGATTAAAIVGIAVLVPQDGSFSARSAWCCMCQGPASRLRFLRNVFRRMVLVRRQTRCGLALALTFVIDVLATSAYQADAAPAYLLLGLLCVAIATTVGLLAGGALVLRIARPHRPRGRGARPPLVTALLLGGVAVFVAAEGPAAGAARAAVRASSTTVARDAGVSTLRRLPPDAVIFASGDDASVPLWYAQRGLRLRPDVTIVATALLTFSWYYDELRALPAFDRRALPASDASIDDGTDFSLSAQRTLALATAVRPGHTLFVTAPDPNLGPLCPQLPDAGVYRCARAETWP